MSEVEIKNVQPHDGKPLIKCRCKKVVIEYFLAITPDGDEVKIKGVDKKDLKDGVELIGTIEEDYAQKQYENGEWSRSYTIEKWLDVSPNSNNAMLAEVPEIIQFGMHLTGHFQSTVEQLYRDWRHFR